MTEIETHYAYILQNGMYRKLTEVPRHKTTDTYTHSIRVAEMTESICRKLHISDEETAVRAALLHDFCLKDHHSTGIHSFTYYFTHPRKAARNAEIFHITKKEAKAIRAHMFPIGPVPTSVAGWILTIADKAVSTKELFGLYEKYIEAEKAA